jgi:peroxiredoxin
VLKVITAVALLAVAVAVVLLVRRPWAQAETYQPAATVTATPEADQRRELSKAAPEFAEETEWLQSEPLTLASLRGQVVVVHFWTFGCINCKHNYPAYKAWQGEYASKGVTIIGIHTPEFEYEADAKQIRAQAEKHGLKFPIALDAGSRNWRNWDNQYWPSIYLIDKKGRVRYRWEGELHLDKAEAKQFAGHIDELLAEKD